MQSLGSPLGPSHLGGEKGHINSININVNKSQNGANALQEGKVLESS